MLRVAGKEFSYSIEHCFDKFSNDIKMDIVWNTNELFGNNYLIIVRSNFNEFTTTLWTIRMFAAMFA